MRKFLSRYKKIIILVQILLASWFLGLGALASWLLTKGGLESFSSLSPTDRILIVAPHIDDEVISAGGLIQEALKNGAKVKVVYMTNGDDSLGSVIRQDKSLNVNPNDFIALGEKRMNEGKSAAKILGLSEGDLVFLGYPDKGLTSMFGNNFDLAKPYTSGATRFSYNPYRGTYKNAQVYAGANVLSDLEEIIKSFDPTVIIVSHPRDRNPDHRTTFLFTQRAAKAQKSQAKIFAYLIHYSLYPAEKKYLPNDFLYPPKRLFTQKGWFSFDLTKDQEDKKHEAVKANSSQKELGPSLYDLLSSFVKRNEIFEEFD